MSIQHPKPNLHGLQGREEVLHRDFIRYLRDQIIDKVRQRYVPVSEQTSAYTARVWDLVPFDPSGGAFTVTLPDNPVDGDEVAFKNTTTDTTGITIAPGTGDTIDGGASINPTGARQGIVLLYDAARRDWSRIAGIG